MQRLLQVVPRRLAKAIFALADALVKPFPGPRLLVYHQVEAGTRREMDVKVGHFEAQLDWLAEHYEVVSLAEALDRRAESDADRLSVLTFDDGYRDFYEFAFPQLRRRGMPFVLYLATQSIESETALTPGGKADPLTWEQVNGMLDSGLLTLGAHTHRHVDLRDADEHQIRQELELSNELIRSRTGESPRHFAYPWGYWSPLAEPIVGELYETAALGSGTPISADTSLLRLSRVPIQRSDGMMFFKRKVKTGLRMEDVVRRMLAGYSGP